MYSRYAVLGGLVEGNVVMVITEHRLDVEEQLAAVEFSMNVEDRSRDTAGHCWDGRTCDHLDHGPDGIIHFMR
jgi:hypothetical protein